MRNPYPQFTWFFGIVTDTSADPLQLGRVRVRAVGFHPSAKFLPDDKLPWAPVMNGGTAKVKKGQMVIGCFLDGEEAQQPFILGTIGGAAAGTGLIDTLSNVVGEWFGPQEEFPETPEPAENSPVPPNAEGYVNPLGTGWYTVVPGGRYGVFRQYYNKGKGGTHNGIDLAAPAGTNIYAAKDGVVARADYSSSYGYVVYINHDDGYQTRYAHMVSAPLVKLNERVKQNQLIGKVGNSGRSRGNHLHYEVRAKPYNNNNAVDPASFGGPFTGK